MLDIKALKTALVALGDEKKISYEKVLDAVEKSLAAAYQKEYGKRGQLVRCKINTETGETSFEQVKTVVDETTVRMPTIEEIEQDTKVANEKDMSTRNTNIEQTQTEGEALPRYNEERHMLIQDARLLNRNITLGEEIVFPLDNKEDFGRIAAQTAKQVIVQKLREAERESIEMELTDKQGQIVSGVVQRVDRGNVFIDLGRSTAVLPFEEQIPQERLNPGDRVRAYLYVLEEGLRGLSIRVSRTHPKFLVELFKLESQEIESNQVEIIHVAREPGSRSKIAVISHDARLDAVGTCVGQRGARVSAVSQELSGEKIDIIEYSTDIKKFIANALSPANVHSIEINEEEKKAVVTVTKDEQSLAIGKGGQNVRLAAKLTGWKIDILSTDEEYNDLDEEADEYLHEQEVADETDAENIIDQNDLDNEIKEENDEAGK